jgi:DNA-binding NarL/FixJ family response regulator
MNPIRILLADDHALILGGIRALLKEIDGVTIIAEVNNGRDAVALARAQQPNLVIMDISMKELNGIDATQAIVNEMPGTKVLVLSMHSAEEFVRRSIKAGASGYVAKDSMPLELRLAVEALMRGEMYLSSRVSHQVLAALADPRSEAESSLESLTLRQREVLQMIAEGKSTREIANALDVSVKTIETHRAALMERLGIHDIAGLVRYAARNHLVSLDNDER